MFFNRISSYFIRYSLVLKTRLAGMARNSKLGLKYLRWSPLVLITASIPLYCAQHQLFTPQIQQINKQQLVRLIQASSSEFVVIIYDKFKRFNEKQFGEKLQPIIHECSVAKVKNIYIIDSKEADHLKQIVSILRNQKSNESESKSKRQAFECYFKSRCFSQGIQLTNNAQYPIHKQVKQIRHFQIWPNNPNITEQLEEHLKNTLAFNKTIVVRQCYQDGQCVDSYKKQIKILLDSGMLNGKTEELKFELILDHPAGILGTSSEYVKKFTKFINKIKQSNSQNKRQEGFVFKKDLFGEEVTIFSQWLEREGLKYQPADRLMMFIRPRINYITKINTYSDLLWFLRTAKLNEQSTISLNNSENWARTNSQHSIQVLRLLYSHFPKLNYLIVNTSKVNELMRHMFADYKYVIFKQDNSLIWKKQFLDLDKLEKIDKKQRQPLFQAQFSDKIQNFIANPQIKSLVQIEKQLEVSLQKLKILKERQLQHTNPKKYLVRVCKERCNRFLTQQYLENVYNKLKQSIDVYWIDSLTQNVGAEDGVYLLTEGNLVDINQVLKN